MLISKGDEKLEIECSGKQYRADRTTFHLANYLHKEAPQLSGKNPGIIAIHVPEAIDWEKIKENQELDHYVKNEFKKPIFDCVTMVVFSCDHPFEKYYDSKVGSAYNTRIRVYKIRNQKAAIKPPLWVS